MWPEEPFLENKEPFLENKEPLLPLQENDEPREQERCAAESVALALACDITTVNLMRLIVSGLLFICSKPACSDMLWITRSAVGTGVLSCMCYFFLRFTHSTTLAVTPFDRLGEGLFVIILCVWSAFLSLYHSRDTCDDYMDMTLSATLLIVVLFAVLEIKVSALSA